MSERARFRAEMEALKKDIERHGAELLTISEKVNEHQVYSSWEESLPARTRTGERKALVSLMPDSAFDKLEDDDLAPESTN